MKRVIVVTLWVCLLVGAQIETLPGTAPLDWEGDLAERLLDGAHRFVERQIAASRERRAARWRRDPSSRQAYEASIEANRRRFRQAIGLVDERIPVRLERLAEEGDPAPAAQTSAYRVWQVRWSVFEGVHGEGLLLDPGSAARASVVVVPDADQLPEQAVGLAPGIAAQEQIARRLAESGCRVLVPVLIDRSSRWSGRPQIRMTDQSHREWIYRQAFHMGRHLIGYEVAKVLAAIDWLGTQARAPVGVAGYGEGGMIAFYAAAADPRVTAALVSGYFGPRERVWSEPIYRNVFGLLKEFGDAEIATLIAPRGLVIEHARAPEVRGHKGDIVTPEWSAVEAEFARLATLLPEGFQPRFLVQGPGSGLEPFAKLLGVSLAPSRAPARDLRRAFDAAARQRRQLHELEAYTQRLVETSERARNEFFLHKAAPELAVRKWSYDLQRPTLAWEPFVEKARWYRDYFRQEIIGQFDEPVMPANPRTRKIRETPKWTGYEVVLDVWPEVFAWGILLVPKDIQPGERRAAVVCQHGLEGLPIETVEGNHPAYRNFAARLAEEGFVVFSPHNLYRGKDHFRFVDRKANALGATLYSILLAQHEQILRWLQSLPFVDGERIGFYGLSYGGKTAMRVPAILENYRVIICSGDFNQWTRKVASTDLPYGYMYTGEWEMFHFNLGGTFDYAEMAYLIFPRPFLVERGHHDTVGEDAWVAHEYAKVRWFYAQFGLGDRTAIAFFNGGHTIHGEAAFAFLRRHLF
ncbi:MAG: dienelactone hydrolase family protein [Bryobacterales bacterium]|nr:dienelactone hydrolase family protein [Bryobacterales bacterium]